MPYRQEMLYIDYMCQEKREEEDLLALRIEKMYQFKDSRTISRKTKKINYSSQSQQQQHEHRLENKKN